MLIVRNQLLLLSTALVSGCTGFREGMPGVFRSPFPMEEQMIRRIEAHDIKSVLCLRGGRSARQSERATMGGGATFTGIPISAKKAPNPDALLGIWNFAKTAERPVMVHCLAGVDRTGLALAIIALHDTGDLKLARRQLAFIPNGHIAAFGTEAMDHVLDEYSAFDQELAFAEWVTQIYTPNYAGSAATKR